jgi:hypothetical protein
MKRASTRITLMLAAVAIAVFALPSAAMAEDNYMAQCPRADTACQTGSAAGLVQGQCKTATSYYHRTQVCVDYAADAVYVYDGQSDGKSAIAEINNDNGSINSRLCRNNRGYGTWAKCDFDWAEAGEHRAWAGYLISYQEMPTDFLWSWTGK